MSYVISNTFERSGAGRYTTTTYVPSIAQDTLPEPQVVPITEELYIPSGAGTAAGRIAAIQAFLDDESSPEILIASDEGEQVVLEWFQTSHHVVYGRTVGTGSLAGYTSEDPRSRYTADELSASCRTNNVDSSSVSVGLVSDSWVSYGIAGESRSVASIRTHSLSVLVNAGEPRKVKIPGKASPRIVYVQELGAQAAKSGAFKIQKIWGYLKSDHFTESEVQDYNPTLKSVDWKKVWTTVGKVVKVIAEVSKVVIPFLLTIVVDEASETEPDVTKLRLIKAVDGYKGGRSINKKRTKRKRTKRLVAPPAKAKRTKLSG